MVKRYDRNPSVQILSRPIRDDRRARHETNAGAAETVDARFSLVERVLRKKAAVPEADVPGYAAKEVAGILAEHERMRHDAVRARSTVGAPPVRDILHSDRDAVFPGQRPVELDAHRSIVARRLAQRRGGIQSDLETDQAPWITDAETDRRRAVGVRREAGSRLVADAGEEIAPSGTPRALGPDGVSRLGAKGALQLGRRRRHLRRNGGGVGDQTVQRAQRRGSRRVGLLRARDWNSREGGDRPHGNDAYSDTAPHPD